MTRGVFNPRKISGRRNIFHPLHHRTKPTKGNGLYVGDSIQGRGIACRGDVCFDTHKQVRPRPQRQPSGGGGDGLSVGFGLKLRNMLDAPISDLKKRGNIRFR